MTEYQKTYIELKKQFVATNEGPDNVRALYTFKEELEQSEDQQAKEVLVDVYDLLDFKKDAYELLCQIGNRSDKKTLKRLGTLKDYAENWGNHYALPKPKTPEDNLNDKERLALLVLPELVAATREAGFGDEVKRRIILGTYALSAGYYDAWYGSAQKVRTLIIEDFKKAFEQVDVLVAPTSPSTAFKFGEKMDDPLAMYMNDIATIPANLAGVPAMSIPAGLSDDGLPVGFQFIAPQQRDEVMYKPAAALEAALEDSWNGPIWNDLKTPWLDGLGK